MTHCTDPLRLLVVVGHPHDITHMAATCAHHVERGDSVAVVAITGGTTVHNEPLLDKLRKPPEQRDPTVLAQTSEAYTADKAHEITLLLSPIRHHRRAHHSRLQGAGAVRQGRYAKRASPAQRRRDLLHGGGVCLL